MAEQNGSVNFGRGPYEEHSGYHFEFGLAIQELSFQELNILALAAIYVSQVGCLAILAEGLMRIWVMIFSI